MKYYGIVIPAEEDKVAFVIKNLSRKSDARMLYKQLVAQNATRKYSVVEYDNPNECFIIPSQQERAPSFFDWLFRAHVSPEERKKNCSRAAHIRWMHARGDFQVSTAEEFIAQASARLAEITNATTPELHHEAL